MAWRSRFISDNLIYALVRAFQILQVQSFEAEANSSQVDCDASARWQGSHASAVIHLECRFSTLHSPSLRQTLTSPARSPDATILASGDQLRHKTWCLCPL